MEISEFKDRLKKYLTETSQANVEAPKAFLFLEFIRDVFKNVNADHPHKLYPNGSGRF